MGSNDYYKIFLTLFAAKEPLEFGLLSKALPSINGLREKLDSLIEFGLAEENEELYKLSEKGLDYSKELKLFDSQEEFNNLFKRYFLN